MRNQPPTQKPPGRPVLGGRLKDEHWRKRLLKRIDNPAPPCPRHVDRIYVPRISRVDVGLLRNRSSTGSHRLFAASFRWQEKFAGVPAAAPSRPSSAQ